MAQNQVLSLRQDRVRYLDLPPVADRDLQKGFDWTSLHLHSEFNRLGSNRITRQMVPQTNAVQLSCRLRRQGR